MPLQLLCPVAASYVMKIFSSSFIPEMSCKSNGNSDGMPSTGGTSYRGENCSGHSPPSFVSGWMYLNENGQMCGPYIQQQLYEGLSTGFLPEDLPVYPIANGILINPVPLNYFKQFPDHVSTGFTYLCLGTSGTTMPTNHFTDLAAYRQEGVQYAAPEAAHPDMESVSDPRVHNHTYSSNQPISNSEAADYVTPVSLVVLHFFFHGVIPLSYIFRSLFLFSSLPPLKMPLTLFFSSQVKIPVGYSRMMMGGSMGHIRFWSFILGNSTGILKIH